ncbi:Hypothetical protein EAG7_02865 [Klebsiella aerogenes]|nr:Hypothetical protein EAG7_02865 [Klebsiella aerogenes]CCG31344.1 hypothetical protein [Klebsiella aerogenes EA1509E]
MRRRGPVANGKGEQSLTRHRVNNRQARYAAVFSGQNALTHRRLTV